MTVYSAILPVGLPGQGLSLGLDPLSGFFLALLVPQVVATAIAGAWRQKPFLAFVGGMVLALLARDGFSLLLGFELMSTASWLMVAKADRRPATLYLGIASLSGACLIPALFLPPGGLAFALILLGAGAKAGLVPLHSWLPRAHPAPPAPISALMSGGMVKIALYVILRYGFVVMGAQAQPWWGVALIVAGAASALIGALRAVLETELKTVLACSTVEHVGLIAIGAGIALRAKAMGDTELASLGLGAALLCAAAHALFKPLLFLGAGAVKEATGTSSLDWLGGLARAMPKLAGLMLAGVAGLTALPFGPGFAPEFLLLHAAIGAARRHSGMAAEFGFAVLTALLGLTAALALAAGLRLFGIGFLGRPRTLRSAAAEEAPRNVRVAMALLAVCFLPLALFPAMVLGALTPVLMLLVPGASAPPLGYAPLPLLLLAGLPVLGAFLANRRFGLSGTRDADPWAGGLAKPPPWLPFGDPATQPSASGFAEPIERALGRALLGVMASGAPRDPGEAYVLMPLARLQAIATRQAERLQRATIRQRLAFILATLVAVLLALAIGGGLISGPGSGA